MKKLTTFHHKIIALLAILAISVFANAHTAQAETYNATRSAVVRAQVYVRDVNPPTAPELLAPFNSQRPYCERTPIFSWRDATDDEGITAYNFDLNGTWYNGSAYNFSQYITGEIDNDTVQVWHEDGIWYLQLKNYLNWGTYSWYVTAYDTVNSTSSPSWNINLDKNECNLGCQTANLINQVEFQAPNGNINSRRPAIVLKYKDVALISAEVNVNNQLVLGNLNLTTSYNAPTYTVNLNQSERKIIIQPNYDYLPNNTNQYLMKLVLRDNNNCAFSPATHQLIYGGANEGSGGESGGGGTTQQPSDEALIPFLISPENESTNDGPVTQFSWGICSPSEQITQQVFYLDKENFATLNMQDQETNTYSYKVQEVEDNQCSGGRATLFSLVLKENLNANDPNNNDDWHRWSVAATGNNGLKMSSATWRFRFFPEGTAIYSWCNSLETCTSGTLKQCLANGSNCYYNDKQECLSNAELDCGPNPPLRTYFWCTGSSNCKQGGLADCGQSGKNCFLKQEQCQEQAAAECGGEALYFSCTTALTCELTDLATCNASGGPCYRQDNDNQRCPANVKNQCQAMGGIFGGTFFNNLVDFPGNGFVLLQKLNLPENALQNLQNWFANIMPWLSLLLLLPCIILICLFPLAKGLIFNARTGEAIQNAVVTVKNALGETIGQTLSDKFGRFPAMKLPKGQFQLVAQAPAYIFPSQTPDPEKKQGGDYYLGQTFTVKNGWNNLPAYQIPLDPTENTAMEKMTFSDWWRRASLRFSNCVSLLWPAAFIIALLITYFYPSVFNLIISGLFVLSWLRKNLAQKTI